MEDQVWVGALCPATNHTWMPHSSVHFRGYLGDMRRVTCHCSRVPAMTDCKHADDAPVLSYNTNALLRVDRKTHKSCQFVSATSKNRPFPVFF